MKKVLLFAFSLLISSNVVGQTDKNWKSVNKENVIKVNKNVERLSFPSEFKLFQVNAEVIRQSLQSAPNRFVQSKSNTIISLPNIKGVMERFEVYEASNFEPELQAQYPNIRSYVGIGLDDKYAQVRLSADPSGIQAMVFRAGKENEFIEPYSNDGSVYAVYNSSRTKGNLPFTCSTVDQEVISDLQMANTTLRSNNAVLKTFRLALSCTAEYSNYFGATSAAQSANVMAAFNATMTRVNGVFEKDMAIHMNIIANNTSVIYYNPSTDPYSAAAAGTGGAWNGELQTTLTNVIGDANYDIGHLFGATGGGGNAGCIGCVCDSGKGSGYTSPADGIPSGDNFDIDYVAHEMGHQYGGNHTFSHSNENNSVNVEPGSGSTIMGYAGITGSTDVQPHSDDYFAYRSILQVQTNLVSKSCPTNTTITHGTPVINAGLDWTIPKSTPFILTGTGSDPGGDTLTYCWEQNDDATTAIGAANSVVSPTKTNGPNWRSRNPEPTPVRYMPKLSSVLNNTLTADWESVSSVARTLNFTLTGRDNVAGGGQTGTDAMVVTVSGTVGPFDVTSQNTSGISWTQGSTQTITWAVNNTTSLVGSSNVDILLSTDGGQTFTTTLASNTPNDGSEVITVPNVAAPYCRVMVKPTGNIYYDINTRDFAIGYVVTDVCNTYTATPGTPIAAQNPLAWQILGSVNVPTDVTISDINVGVNITHTNIHDLYIGLLKPGATTVGEIVIVYQQGCTSGANMITTFDDEGVALNCTGITGGNAYVPLNSLTSLDGLSSLGDWRLVIADVSAPNNGTLNSFSVEICSTTVTLNSETFGLTDFNLYPNPNNGNFTVQFSSETSNDVNINVHDLRGREVYTKSFQNNGLFNQELQLNNVSSGIYLVTVQDGNRKEVKKIIVE